MKTTIILPDALIKKAKNEAKRNSISLTKLIEESLIEKMNHSEKGKTAFKVDPFHGDGLVSTDLDGNWNEIRKIIYENT